MDWHQHRAGELTTVKQRTQGGLAAQIVRVSFTVGLLTVSVAVIVASISAYRLSAEKAAGRDLLALQVVDDRIAMTLQRVVSVADSVSGRLAVTRDDTESLSDAAGVLLTNKSLFKSAYVARANGTLLASVPADPDTPVKSLPAFVQARRGVDGFFLITPEVGAGRELWFTRAGIRKSGTSFLIVAQVDDAFLDDLVRTTERSLPDRAIVVLDQDRVLAASPLGEGMRLGTAQWAPTDASAGRVSARAVDGAPMTGHYADLGGIPGVDWRVVITEPAGVAVRDTLRAVTPAVLVLVIGGSAVILALWGMSRRLARPLRELERAALSAASGSYVRQLATDRDDEIGRVAGAFNLVALRLNALQDLSQLLASASELDQVLDRILSAMGHIVGPGAAAIYLVDDSTGVLSPVRTRGIDLSDAEPVSIDRKGWLASTLGTDDPVDITCSEERLAAELPGIRGSHSGALAAPLVAGAEALGVVVVLRDSQDPVTDAEREMVRTFSAQAAVAVNNSRLFTEERDSRRIAEALRAVAEELVRPEELDVALRAVRSIVQVALGATYLAIVPVNSDVFGLEEQAPGLRSRDIVETAKHAQLVAGGDAIMMTAGDKPASDRLLDEFGGTHLIVAPIALEHEYGAVMIGVLPPSVAATTDLLALARAFADEVALALENAYFYERAVTRAANLETIFRISQAVGSSLQVNVVLNRVLDVVQKILAADAVALLSYDPRKKTLTTAMARGAVPTSVVHMSVGPGEDLPGRVFATAEPVAVHDLQASMKGVEGAAADNDLRSLLAVPLLARGRSIGVLMVFSIDVGAFDAEDMNVLQTFAAQAALALDTARLYSREHDVATVLQQAIIPAALPDFAELSTSSVYQPAGADTEIGGDYYDLFRARDGSVWLSIADVCGKGVLAATKTTMIKFAVRALVAAGLTPAGVASEVNRMTTESGELSDIVTLWVGRYDPVLRSMVWANGGHPPGLLRRVDGTIERLVTTGPLLGAAVDAHFDEIEAPLAEGDSILLFTDGVTEARVGNTFYGEERVTEFFARSYESASLATDLLDEVRDFTQGDLRDDVAILSVVIRNGDSEMSADVQEA